MVVVDIILDRGRALVLQPDLVFVSRDRMDIVHERIYGAPDLAVEVLSPHPCIGRLDERVRWFAEFGVREIWLYQQPDQPLEILECAGGAVGSRRTVGWRDAVRSAVLPDFTPTLESIFTGAPPATGCQYSAPARPRPR
jgi:Uma2 family endonuclease